MYALIAVEIRRNNTNIKNNKINVIEKFYCEKKMVVTFQLRYRESRENLNNEVGTKNLNLKYTKSSFQTSVLLWDALHIRQIIGRKVVK